MVVVAVAVWGGNGRRRTDKGIAAGGHGVTGRHYAWRWSLGEALWWWWGCGGDVGSGWSYCPTRPAVSPPPGEDERPPVGTPVGQPTGRGGRRGQTSAGARAFCQPSLSLPLPLPLTCKAAAWSIGGAPLPQATTPPPTVAHTTASVWRGGCADQFVHGRGALPGAWRDVRWVATEGGRPRDDTASAHAPLPPRPPTCGGLLGEGGRWDPLPAAPRPSRCVQAAASWMQGEDGTTPLALRGGPFCEGKKRLAGGPLLLAGGPPRARDGLGGAPRCNLLALLRTPTTDGRQAACSCRPPTAATWPRPSRPQAMRVIMRGGAEQQ